MARVDELIALLPWGLTQEPGALPFLRGLLEPVARVEGFLDVKAARSLDLLDPGEIPDALVDSLASTVGVGRDFPPAFGLSIDEQRRLIAVAVALWKRKGTRVSWRQAVLYLAGARALIVDWFEHRIVEGASLEVHLVPDPEGPNGLIPLGQSHYEYPAFTSDVWLADPASTINIDAVLRWLDAMRAANERINVMRAEFVEDLLQGTELWTIELPALAGNGLQTLEDGTRAIRSTGGNTFVADPSIPFVPSTDSRQAFALLRVTGEAWLFVDVQDDLAQNAYGVRIDMDDTLVQVYRITAGVPTSLGVLQVPHELVEGFPYRWRVDVQHLATVTVIYVTWEGLPLGQAIDVTGAYDDGRFGFAAGVLASHVAELQQALVYRHTPTVYRVGPSP